ncbi:uncharacterized protein LOC129583366 [Paramacrobiotus metropolitanus]|uniref:uncharacterized protein LOC129583366 n=1 Tax=Paramacrobiotus metropolitanus TaxID=2943436 RepID=UPI002445EBF0|nr:uncharacterized protein LOC129583366 [Paramacrobiotus metropolitanus]
MEEKASTLPFFTVRPSNLPVTPGDGYASQFDISRKNIIALASTVSLIRTQNPVVASSDGFPKAHVSGLNTDRRGTKRTVDDQEKNGRNDSHPDEHDDHVEKENLADSAAGIVSTVYLCDVENVWRPFEIFRFSGRPSVVRWSNSASTILVCSERGIFYILTNRTGAMNAWHLLHRGNLNTEDKIIHVAWLKQLIHFSSETEPPTDGIMETPEKPPASWTAVSSNQDSEDYLDGFFCVTHSGKIVFVTVQGKMFPGGKTKCSVTSVDIPGDIREFSMADSVFDPDDHRFILTVGHPALSEIICLKIGLSEESVSPLRSPSALIDNLVNIPLKRKISQLSWLSGCGQKEHFLAVATVNDDEESPAVLEIWALSLVMQDDFLLSLDAEVIEPTAVKLFWTCQAEKAVPFEIVSIVQSVQCFYSSDIPRQGTMALQGRNHAISLLNVKLDMEISFSDLCHFHLNPPKPDVAAHSPVCFSANGFLLLCGSADSRLVAWRVPQEFWSFLTNDDPTRLLLNTSGDFCDFLAVMEPSNVSAELELLESTYRTISALQKQTSRLRYYRLRAGLTEKLAGKESGFIVLLTVYFDSFLSYLEQFLTPDDASLTSIFHISELMAILEQADATLDAVVSVVDRQVAFDKTALCHVQTGFHQVLVVTFDFLMLCVKHQHVLMHAGEALTKVRLILATLAAWIGSQGFFKQLWRRPALYPAALNILDIMFSATAVLLTGTPEKNLYGDLMRVLEEINVEDDAYGRNWKELYIRAQSRISVEQSEQMRYIYNLRFPYAIHASPEMEKNGNNKEAKSDDAEILMRKPGRRKFCSRCYFNFPWRLKTNSAGSWTSHIQQRWTECFCGGQWIFLE